MSYSRREMCLMVGALAASPRHAAASNALLSKSFPYADMPVREKDGIQFRAILSGELHTGCPLGVHQTRLPSGAVPHPPHHHVHEEMFLIREGTIDLTVNGKTTRLGPGSAGFVASNDVHGARNVGATPAEYFVIAFAKDG